MIDALITAAAVLFVALCGFLGWVVRELGALRVAVAVIHAELIPDNAPSLSSTVNRHSAQLAVHDAWLANLHI